MTQEETKILAMVECLLVWDWLSERNFKPAASWVPLEGYKWQAISALYAEEKLHKGRYYNACPFCDAFNMACARCLWRTTGLHMHCFSEGSPFVKWEINPTAQNAKKVLDFLLSIEF